MDQIEDLKLVHRAKSGDDAAFTELVSRHGGRVYHHALRLMGNAQDAEEVLQDTFLQVHRKLDSFEERSRFSTWVYRIATNEALMRLRKAHRKREVFFDDTLGKGEKWFADEIRDFSRSALEELLDAEKMELLQRALSEVPEEYRAVFTLRDIDGLSNTEVAEILELSVPAVKSRLHRCRVYLRDRLSLLLGEDKGARSAKKRQ